MTALFRNSPALVTSIFLCSLVSCNRSIDQGQTLPFGSVDIPRPSATLHGTAELAGWALADQPIEEVSIFLDGKYLASASIGQPRPDVAKAKPAYSDAAKAGWTAALDSLKVQPGWHELLVQARTTGGRTRDLGVLPVLIER